MKSYIRHDFPLDIVCETCGICSLGRALRCVGINHDTQSVQSFVTFASMRKHYRSVAHTIRVLSPTSISILHSITSDNLSSRFFSLLNRWKSRHTHFPSYNSPTNKKERLFVWHTYANGSGGVLHNLAISQPALSVDLRYPHYT